MVLNINKNLEQKQQIRDEMIKKRNRLSNEEVEEYSANIRNTLKELEPVRKAQNIMLFSNIKSEVNIRPLIEELSTQKTVLLPRVEKNGNMVAVGFTGWKNMKNGPFSIKEPIGEPFLPDQIDVVIVPGLAFDDSGNRIGYGKGYYDRFLKRVREDTFLCGVCYEFQVVEKLYPQEADVPVHWIVTNQSELVIDWDYF
ncbi:5-formyltetrahydrofolate cyclo-ligase [Candidatus Syntrophocurvum alkaliphilum]|uniref:5-formyltetrahydrofolate cyclo-ligase n=1 Tax=Candidatus Syntrophocurvum alkaliphilum TaxID=2293317 RepID=A0A6I6DBE6_9FIRM|nr:5-formyltetrahydrofolate cyclo-ligase [Candidatus Syntrophocurvum alkaliphilum]QGT98755.1 5-formyltetrahydrofolate cyclo-ligase [Candidatus Syntrophocurvum alkaliphilum]